MENENVIVKIYFNERRSNNIKICVLKTYEKFHLLV